VFPKIPFPEASVVGVGFPEASVVEEENNENGSKFGENKSLILVVPPNSDEIIYTIFIFDNLGLMKQSYKLQLLIIIYL
jgi:hypothetical protein